MSFMTREKDNFKKKYKKIYKRKFVKNTQIEIQKNTDINDINKNIIIIIIYLYIL